MAITCKCKHAERSSVAGETGAMWPAGKPVSVEAPRGDVMDAAEVSLIGCTQSVFSNGSVVCVSVRVSTLDGDRNLCPLSLHCRPGVPAVWVQHRGHQRTSEGKKKREKEH